MSYNYLESKNRIDNILSSETLVIKKDKVPSSDDEFTYSNGIKTWVGSIFVDMVNSSKLCESSDENTARIFRALCSELIAIMKDDINFRQIGIRGDCVYSINTTQYKSDLIQLFKTAVRINTFMKMFNKRLDYYGYNSIEVGIGLGCSEELVIKAGQVGSGINDKIWIGKAVIDAAHLSDKANRNALSPILMSDLVYSNIKDLLIQENESYANWIALEYYEFDFKKIYGCNIIDIAFDNWIKRNC
ncbi:MAG: hypothetical protein E7A37_03325 [Negativicoccus succinicivorans]|nr:hypothetical protein [Negativicoccus succinicivorans]